jgi:hypothetical protein
LLLLCSHPLSSLSLCSLSLCSFLLSHLLSSDNLSFSVVNSLISFSIAAISVSDVHKSFSSPSLILVFDTPNLLLKYFSLTLLNNFLILFHCELSGKTLEFPDFAVQIVFQSTVRTNSHFLFEFLDVLLRYSSLYVCQSTVIHSLLIIFESNSSSIQFNSFSEISIVFEFDFSIWKIFSHLFHLIIFLILHIHLNAKIIHMVCAISSGVGL